MPTEKEKKAQTDSSIPALDFNLKMYKDDVTESRKKLKVEMTLEGEKDFVNNINASLVEMVMYLKGDSIPVFSRNRTPGFSDDDLRDHYEEQIARRN